MNEKLVYHFSKTLKTIRSCKTEEQIISSKNMVHNFIRYWTVKIPNDKNLSGYITCLNLVLKHKQNTVLDHE